ncbi:glycosyltransferase family 4 protein [Robiginitomaculum antarcticum]|uniref:glycosyltransferase family 4 protein n=1 Tax=Robiginitomaculum antarcticum TaxID=437507 RepID=UPI0003810B3E|nr:hypothetical protein [Robiginitomaculum antarcticum]
MSQMFTHITLIGFFTALAVTGFMIALKISDHPNARSSHAVVTPTGGGMGIVIGAVAVMAALTLFYPRFDIAPEVKALFGLGIFLAGLGLLDDVFGVPTRIKFIFIGLLSIAVPLITGLPLALPLGDTVWPFPDALAHFGAALWVFVVINVVNFMDGSNGLMGLTALVISAALVMIGLLAGVSTAAIFGLLLFGPLMGFLVYNLRRKARIFSGDTGSLFVGYMIAVASLSLPAHPHGERLLYVGPILLLPFLADSLLTMAVRARRGERLMAPHRRHIYQRAILSGRGHVAVALIYTGLAVICAFGVIFGGITEMLGSGAYFLGFVSLALTIYAVAHQRLKIRD